jgi:hypothetical protein
MKTMRTMVPTFVIGGALLSACSTIIEGRSQTIAINTTPVGASCAVTRLGETLGKVSATPGSVYIVKTKADITIACDKEGYEQAVAVDKSGAAAATGGNVIMTIFSPIGWAIDSATGSDNKYDTPVNVTLTKK